MFYSTEQLEASSFITHLDEIHQEEVFGIKAACDAIQAQQKICLAHPASCQYNRKSISNYKRMIRIRSKSLFRSKKYVNHPHILLLRTLLLNAMEISSGTPVKVKQRSLTNYLRTLRSLPVYFCKILQTPYIAQNLLKIR